MLATLHRLLVALTLLAFVGGVTLQLMPPDEAFAANMMRAGDDCSQMIMPPDDAGTGHKTPCKGSNLPECIKQMGCLGTPNLPVRLGAEPVPFAYGKVVYWTPAIRDDGRSIEPDLFPPIGL